VRATRLRAGVSLALPAFPLMRAARAVAAAVVACLLLLQLSLPGGAAACALAGGAMGAGARAVPNEPAPGGAHAGMPAGVHDEHGDRSGCRRDARAHATRAGRSRALGRRSRR